MNRWLRSIALLTPLTFVACTSDPQPGPGGATDASTDAAPTDAAADRPADSAACRGLESVPPIPAFVPREGVPVGAIGQVMGRPPGNLQINQPRMGTSVQFQRRTFAENSCEVIEGCTMPGSRRLLRFDLETPNNGEGDMYLGAPTMAGRAGPQFEWATCHRHYHFIGYADYRLYDNCGTEVGRGHKQSFCLEDSRYTGNGGSPRVSTPYDCSNQGIHAGYSDVYSRVLDCQFVDVTDVPPGTYYLRARINLDRTVAESNYDDNVAVVEVTIPDENGTTPTPTNNPLNACSLGEQGPDRDCGWELEGTHTCTPGARVSVGCDTTCSPAIGSNCQGDSMIRICPGTGACTGQNAIVQSDNSGCGSSLCPVARNFVCPSSGRYSVLIGTYASGSPSACIIGIQ